MELRACLLPALVAAALLLGGCASAEPADTADDYSTFHSEQDKPADGHGWGVNVQNNGAH